MYCHTFIGWEAVDGGLDWVLQGQYVHTSDVLFALIGMQEAHLRNIFSHHSNYWQPYVSMSAIADHKSVPVQGKLVWNTSIEKCSVENIQPNWQKLDFPTLILIS